MAVLENNKPQTEKTSASVTLTLPRLYPTTKLDLKDTSCNIPKLKSLTPRSRTIPNESENRPGVADHLNENLSKSKLTKLNNCNRVREFTSRALSLISPRNYHGQIPVLRRRSFNFAEMSPPDLRSPSPPKKKEKSSNKVKTITFEENSKKKHKTRCSRSPSPVKKASDINKKSKSRSSTSPVRGNSKNSEQVIALKRSDSSKPATSPRTSSPSKTKAKPKVMSSSNVSVLPAKNKSGKESKRQIADTSSNIIKQASQPSLSKSEKIIQPQEKISLDHIKNEVYPGDHRRLSLEKVHLCIEQNYNKSERKRSFFVAYSSEQLQDQKALPLSFLKKVSSTDFPLDVEKRILGEEAEETEAIRTLSGQELILTPSMKLEIEKEEADCLEISSLLNGTGENFGANKDIHIPQDDANEYDSELSTDGELGERKTQPSREDGVYKNYQDSDSLWKSREADLLNDVDYRQSVYHPAVSRRQNSESEEMDFRARSKSIEDNFDFGNKESRRIVRTHSSNLKSKYSSQCFADNMDSAINDRSWASCFDKTDEKSIYNSVLQDVPFYGMKRIRTKKERVSGAFLRFTLKIIRLLAIFNMWPGDNCYMLTSQLLRFSR